MCNNDKKKTDSSQEECLKLRGLVKTLGSKKYSIDPRRILSLQTNPSAGFVKRIQSSMVASIKTLMGITMTAILSPIFLLLPTKFHKKLVAASMPSFMEQFGKKFSVERETLLEDLSGKVLDVGACGGAYFKYFTNAETIVALEPVEEMHELLKEKAKELGLSDKVILTSNILEEFEGQNPNQVGTFDWIIFGNVLCEVPDVRSALEVADRLLKKGTGKVFFCEHIAQSKGTVMRVVQKLVNPWWVRASMGCNCNRDTLEILQAMKGWDLVFWKYDGICVGQPWNTPMILGLAKKI